MYLKAKKYKDVWLAPGSVAITLLEEGKLKELDKHLYIVRENAKILEGAYDLKFKGENNGIA